jgi:hypothetical protein
MLLYVLFAALFAKVALAFPNQPGSCGAGIPLQGSHLTNAQIGTGAISDGGFSFRIGGSTLDPRLTFSAPSGGTDIELSGTSSFRGFLIRISGQGIDTSNFLVLGTGSRELSLCADQSVGGLGHSNNDSKSTVTGLLEVETATTGLTIEVTVVVSNGNGISEWYMSTYSVDVVAAAPSMSAPVNSLPTTAAPVFDQVDFGPVEAQYFPTSTPSTLSSSPAFDFPLSFAPVEAQYFPTSTPSVIMVAPVTLDPVPLAPIMASEGPSMAPVTSAPATIRPSSKEAPAPLTTKVPSISGCVGDRFMASLYVVAIIGMAMAVWM